MAWRSNKEAAHAAYCALGGSEQQAARRDQIIHNARTNWELLRLASSKVVLLMYYNILNINAKA